MLATETFWLIHSMLQFSTADSRPYPTFLISWNDFWWTLFHIKSGMKYKTQKPRHNVQVFNLALKYIFGPEFLRWTHVSGFEWTSCALAEEPVAQCPARDHNSRNPIPESTAWDETNKL